MGSVTGKSGGTDGGPDVSEFLRGLNERSDELFDLARPVLQQAAGGVSEILSTGGTQAQIPAIQQALAASRAAGSQTLRRAEEQGARAGITGTDYQSLVSDLIRSTEGQTAGIPFGFTSPVLQGAYGAVFGAPQLSIQAEQAGAGVAGGIRSQELANQGQIWSTIFNRLIPQGSYEIT